MASIDLTDPTLAWEPATEESLQAAGIDPDDWRDMDGEILGSDDLGAGPSDGASVISAQEMSELHD